MTNQKTLFKIGIDVATNKTGIGVFKSGQVEPIYAGLIVSKEDGGFFRGDKVSQDAINYQAETAKIVLAIHKHISAKALGDKADEKMEEALKNIKVIIAIEVSNHANKSLAQKLGVYAGMSASIIALQFAHIGISFIRDNLEIKFVNPNEWKLRTFGTTADREISKEATITYCNSKFFNGEIKLKAENIGKGHDDIADALCIANLADVLRDNFTVGQQRHTRLKQEQNNKVKIAVIHTKLSKLKDELTAKKQKHLEKVLTSKNSKYDLEEEKQKALTNWANTSQLTRLQNYENELTKLGAELDKIREFTISKGGNNV